MFTLSATQGLSFTQLIMSEHKMLTGIIGAKRVVLRWLIMNNTDQTFLQEQFRLG